LSENIIRIKLIYHAQYSASHPRHTLRNCKTKL